jgi:(p)ppGpp synthase/HD superfamily hydrolase
VLRGKSQFVKRAKASSKTEIKIIAEDRIGLIKDISSLLARSHINISGFNTQNPAGSRFSINKIECPITEKQKIEKIILKIKKMKGIKEISYKLV